MNSLRDKTCVPCEGGTAPLAPEQAFALLEKIQDDWNITCDNKAIERTFERENFKDALTFVNNIGDIAEAEGHHPDIRLHDYKKVTVTLTTHAINGLSENDFIVATKIDSSCN